MVGPSALARPAGDEAVALAPDGPHDAVGGGAFELVAEVGDVAAERLEGVRVEFDGPALRDQFAGGYGLVRAAHEDGEQLSLFAGKGNLALFEAQAAAACESFKKKAMAELDAVHQQKAKLLNELTEARNGAKDLDTKLAVERIKVGTLQEEKQKLMTGTTTTKDEIARMQKRMSELETDALRARELQDLLKEREQEISRLQEAAAERDALNTKVAALMQEREQLKTELQRQRDALKSAK